MLLLPNFYSSLASWMLVLLALASVSARVSAAPTERPNVVVIYTDDQGYGDVAYLNPQAKFATPNFDRLAAEGLCFTDAHCSDTVCTPSRYGLLTGRYSWRTPLKKGVMGAEGECLIADGRMTLASLLRDAGYHTGMVGKWHLGMDFPGEPASRDWSQPVVDMPLDKGFDYFFGVPASLNYGVLAWFEGRHARVPPILYTNKKPNDRHSDYRIQPPYQHTSEETQEALGTRGMEVAADFVDSQCLTRFTDEAIAWMRKQSSGGQAEQPFFLYLPYTSPHYPVCPLPQFHGQGAAGGYGEFVIETDYHVGRILQFLEQSGLDRNTLIVFTSDNGPENSWTQRVKEFDHRSNGIYRDGKRAIYEGGHRVPFLVRWPAGIEQPGRQIAQPICQTDLLATLAEMLGRDLPEAAGEDSHSFYAALKNAHAASPRPPIIHHAANGRFAIRDGNWKLVMAHGRAPRELYDLQRDPSEQQDVVDNQPEVVERLTRQLTDVVLRGRSTAGGAQANDTGHWSDLTWIRPQDFPKPVGAEAE